MYWLIMQATDSMSLSEHSLKNLPLTDHKRTQAVIEECFIYPQAIKTRMHVWELKKKKQDCGFYDKSKVMNLNSCLNLANNFCNYIFEK